LLLDFLEQHSEHRYVISTHSAILINSVDPTRITHLGTPAEGHPDASLRPEVSSVLFDLGYRNSDFLFFDRLVIVEGDSDQEILPILLKATGRIARSELERTGFPTLDGVGDIQVSIQRMEKFLQAVGKPRLPRMYLLDGDQKKQEATLSKTKNPTTAGPVSIRFLRSAEIENYLLVSGPISDAINEELLLADPPPKTANAEDIDKLMVSNAKPKGSETLKAIYEVYGLKYNKKRSGRLIAKRITIDNQPAISEIADLLKTEFGAVIS